MSKSVGTLAAECFKAAFVVGLAMACIILTGVSSRAQDVRYVQHITIAVNKSVTLTSQIVIFICGCRIDRHCGCFADDRSYPSHPSKKNRHD